MVDAAREKPAELRANDAVGEACDSGESGSCGDYNSDKEGENSEESD